MKHTAIFFLLSALALAFAEEQAAEETIPTLKGVVRADSDCATFCRFRLCEPGNSGDPIVLPTGFGLPFPPSFTAQSPFICRDRGPRIGRVFRTREARVRINSGRFVRISRFGRDSLRARFNPRFFQVRELTLPGLFGSSAIARSKFRSMDQRRVLENRCVFLPIRTWEILRDDGSVRRVVSSRARRNCVSFLSTGQDTMIKITFSWDTAADLDLALIEPGDNTINFNNNKSPNGGFLFEDVALGDCESNEGARDSIEMIEYSGLATPLTGLYTVELSQFASCQGVDTDWTLTVMIGDEIVLDESGTVSPIPDGNDNAELFGTFVFNFPAGGPPVGPEEPIVSPDSPDVTPEELGL